MRPQPAYMAVLPGKWKGLAQRGNINLLDRPLVHNPDGSISTVKSISFNVGGKEILIPQVVKAQGHYQVVSPHQALIHYLHTGEMLGSFNSPQAANRYAQALHLQQQRYIGG